MASGSNSGVGRRKDQRLIHPAELEQLRELAQDGRDVREALEALGPKRLQMMETARLDAGNERAQGWLDFDSDLGDAILAVQARRG
jgi:hypothetical protein